jgi:cellulose synthase/poly-beta-1,6-N-acetylglucosamine synthase-like glycosyltransferase
MNVPFISVVVPVWNGDRFIEDCLDSILATDYPTSSREIIVVDNGSTDRTAMVVRRYPVTCVSETQRGPAAARNRGISASRGEIVAFTDADCVVTRAWLRELAAALSDDTVAAVAGEIEAHTPRTPSERFVAMRRPRLQEAAMNAVRPYFATGNLAVRREVFTRVGTFDPRFITGEDQDFAWRFLAAGLRGGYAPRALVYHRHRSSGWEFFKQQVGWARGHMLLRRHYGLPWGIRAELGQYMKLIVAIAGLVAATTRYPFRGRDVMDLYFPLFMVVRELAWRFGGIAELRARLRDERAPRPTLSP